MTSKRIKVSRRMLFTWLILAGLIFFFAPQKLTDKFQLAFARIFHWPLSIGRSISLSVSTQQSPADTLSPREIQYQNHIANLIAQRDEARRKVEKLSGLRNRFALEGAKLVPADVMRAITNGRNELIINRGENDELALGQFVLAYNSIIGTVSSVDSRAARVKLITDPTSQIPVSIKTAQSDINRVMQGIANNSAKVSMIDMKHKIKIGSFVYARKKPGFLGTPIIIGKVTRCERDNENPSLWDITVEPACNIERLNDVAVIVMNPQE